MAPSGLTWLNTSWYVFACFTIFRCMSNVKRVFPVTQGAASENTPKIPTLACSGSQPRATNCKRRRRLLVVFQRVREILCTLHLCSESSAGKNLKRQTAHRQGNTTPKHQHCPSLVVHFVPPKEVRPGEESTVHPSISSGCLPSCKLQDARIEIWRRWPSQRLEVFAMFF